MSVKKVSSLWAKMILSGSRAASFGKLFGQPLLTLCKNMYIILVDRQTDRLTIRPSHYIHSFKLPNADFTNIRLPETLAIA